MLAGAALVVMTALGAVRGEAADSLGLAAVALTLAALPAALPAAVTVILAYATRALARAGAIVQRPPVLETLGSMSAINADASGLADERSADRGRAGAAGSRTDTAIAGTIRHVAGEPEVALEPSLLGFALSSGAVVSGDGLTGDPVEGALFVLAEKGGLDVAVTRSTIRASRRCHTTPPTGCRRRFTAWPTRRERTWSAASSGARPRHSWPAP